ncbi:MFS transporter [Bradyrhizobium sp. U87765 SZCCT0131]|nr:MFS transporter [Bradyrhizobium sp. U87765 SZCCT0131]MBR1261854.1 MFS transporter [Bradyrhizobium sp. U87765 SZCCT0134]MBR1306293.1 MFS transporter [Bradyrhizobium sp. U87765 SZCCT0110]MBR1317636.1 MFS transporter [Bradyrhizobium sp. U87765 SZCCT0109]MBR1351338.1 MFS transporter [Bradyrhizobium sp. U87765 SZCCT0048]
MAKAATTAGGFAGTSAVSSRTSVLVVALCWIAIFSEGYDVGVLGAILPALATDASWKLTPLELGALGSYTLLGMLAGGLLSGMLSDLYGRKPLFVGCLTLFAACMVVTAWSPTPAWFGISRFIAGLGLGGIIPVAAALTIEYSPSHRKSLNYGIMYSGYSIGILVAALVGKAILPEHGWRPVVLVGALPVVFVPLMAWLLPESLESLVARGRTDAARKLAARLRVAVPSAPAKVQQVGWKTVLGEIFSPRNAFATVCFWIALFMGLLLVYGIAQWLPQIMRKSGYNLGDALLFLAVFSFTSAIGGIVLGQWADRFGVRLTVTLAYLLGAVGIAALAFKGPLWVNYAMVAVAGFGTVSASLILTGYLADYLAPFARSAGTGWALSFARIGALTGPLVGGYIASLSVGPQWNFYVFAVIAAIAAVATALIPAKRVG